MTMHPLKHFEDSFDNAQWRKTKQMQCDHACFDPTALRVHLKSHNGEKPTKVQPMWLGIFSGSQFEKTLDNTQHGEKQNICNQCDYASSQASNLRTHFKKWRKVKQMWLCMHLKTNSGENSNKCPESKCSTTNNHPRQAIYWDIHILGQIIQNCFGEGT